jgi:hypothetical protein
MLVHYAPKDIYTRMSIFFLGLTSPTHWSTPRERIKKYEGRMIKWNQKGDYKGLPDGTKKPILKYLEEFSWAPASANCISFCHPIPQSAHTRLLEFRDRQDCYTLDLARAAADGVLVSAHITLSKWCKKTDGKVTVYPVHLWDLEKEYNRVMGKHAIWDYPLRQGQLGFLAVPHVYLTFKGGRCPRRYLSRKKPALGFAESIETWCYPQARS